MDLKIYNSIEDFFEKNKGKKMAFFSSHGVNDFWDIPYEKDMFLIFGKESSGLPDEILEQNKEHCYRIPILSDKIRSLNLANAVSIAVYEGVRRLKM